MTYHMTLSDRLRIQQMREAGLMISEIARATGRGRNCIAFELRKGATGERLPNGAYKYDASVAQERTMSNVAKRGNRTARKEADSD